MHSYSILFVIAFVAVALAAPAQLTYKPGQLFKYALQSNVQTGAQNAPGPLSKMVGTVEVECTEITKTGNYMFVMNMFNVQVEVDPSEKKQLNVGGQPLGYDMYFEQTPAGDVVNVWYEDGDEPYFVQVKLGAINSFQTHVLQPGNAQTIQEQDLVGTHNSNYAAAGNNDGSTSVAKGFTQVNVIQFADKALSPSNVQLQASGSVGVHPQGYVISTNVQQTVTFSSLASVARAGKKAPTDAVNGFDTLLTGVGSLQLAIQPSSARLRRTPALKGDGLSNYKRSNLAALGALVGQMALGHRASVEVKKAEDLASLLGGKSFKMTQMKRIAAFFRQHPKRVAAVVEPAFALKQELLAHRLFALLAQVASPESEALFVSAGLKAQSESLRVAALNTLSTSQSASSTFSAAILAILNADAKLQSASSKAAALALGSLASRTADTKQKTRSVEVLRNLFLDARRRQDVPAIRALQGAFKNAGMRLAELSMIDASPFPYNQSYSKTVNLGGSELSAEFTAELFVGTNFDCTQPTFNMEGYITANANVTLFGSEMNALNAIAIYGQEGSSVVANQLLLEVFGKVVYNEQIPAPDLNCQQDTYPLGSFTAPGLNAEYTLWLGCIPIILDAGLTLEAQLSWGWQVCPGSLSAMVEIMPEAKLVASASAEADLLIIEGAVSLDADFDVTLTPQAYIDGTKCVVGLDLLLTADPMEASLDAEWRKMECKWWFWDCNWGPWTQDTLWSWSAPANNEQLYNQQWPIPH